MGLRGSGDHSLRFDEFDVLAKQNENEIYVVLAQLDPDAIGSAALFRTLCKKYNRKIKIRYAGGIEHPQNECIFNLFELDKTFKKIEILPEGAEIALLDSAMLQDCRLGPNPIAAKYIIDHHMTATEPPDKCWYFIESFGSSCTILALMLRHFGIEFDEGDDAPTLGAVGIYSDTTKFTSPQTTEQDVEAFHYLMRQGSWDNFRRVYDFRFPSDYYKILEVVLNNSKTYNTLLISCGGFLKEDQGAYLAIIAEDLIKQDGISTVITWGVIGDYLVVKARSNNNNLRLDRFMKEKFGEKNAGAKLGAGGANVNLGFLVPKNNNRESLLRCLEDTIIESLVDPASEASYKHESI